MGSAKNLELGIKIYINMLPNGLSRCHNGKVVLLEQQYSSQLVVSCYYFFIGVQQSYYSFGKQL